MSINRKALGSALGGANTPATSLTSKGVVNHDGKDWSEVVGDKKNAAYNPTEAKKLYKKALKELGVDVPQAVKLAELLRERGLSINNDVTKTEELVKQIKLAKGWI